MDGKSVDGWITVFTTGTDYEADLVCDRLEDAGIEAVVLAHRDHAFNLNVGKLSTVRVLVPPQNEHAARELLAQAPLSDEELERAALRASPFVDPDPEGDDDA